MALSLPEALELRCRVAAQLAELSFGGWVERTLRLAAEAELRGPGGADVLAQARDRYEQGQTMAQAVQGIEAAPRTPALGRVDRAAVAAGIAAGRTDAELAAELGCSPQTVERARRALGVQLRATPAPPVADSTLQRLHAEGLATVEIARRTGLTLGSARTRLSKLGLADNRRRK